MSIVLALIVGSVVFAAGSWLAGRRDVARIGRRVEAHVQITTREQLGSPAGAGRLRRQLDELDKTLSRHAAWGNVVLKLERAGVDRRPIDVAALVAAVTLLLALLATAAGALLVAFVVLAGVPGVALLVLRIRAHRRVAAFDAQLPDVLAALSSSLRAGHGFLQGLQAVANDAPAPAGPELRRALSETRLGRPVDEALAGVAARVPSKDFSFVLTAIAVQRQVGGSLAGLFESVNDTVRQRQQFARKVRALTATGRTSAYSLVALPFGVGLLLTLVNHSYLMPLFASGAGRLLVFFGLTSLLVGTLIVRQIVSFKG